MTLISRLYQNMLMLINYSFYLPYLEELKCPDDDSCEW